MSGLSSVLVFVVVSFGGDHQFQTDTRCALAPTNWLTIFGISRLLPTTTLRTTYSMTF